jgi:hypothetical protein
LPPEIPTVFEPALTLLNVRDDGVRLSVGKAPTVAVNVPVLLTESLTVTVQVVLGAMALGVAVTLVPASTNAPLGQPDPVTEAIA